MSDEIKTHFFYIKKKRATYDLKGQLKDKKELYQLDLAQLEKTDERLEQENEKLTAASKKGIINLIVVKELEAEKERLETMLDSKSFKKSEKDKKIEDLSLSHRVFDF